MDNWKTIVSTAEKWYYRLSFPDLYADKFSDIIETTKPCEIYDIESYIKSDINDAATNLIMCLYFCDALEQRYRKENIPQSILYDTLSDIVIWTDLYYEASGSFGLSEIQWIYYHLSFKLFRVGRLQFKLGKCTRDIPGIDVFKGEEILEIHIPSGSPLDFSQCKQSIQAAKKFYADYFGDTVYKCFTCGSWLLGNTIELFINKKSNIIKFQSLFNITDRYESYAILQYTVDWYASRDTLHKFNPPTELGKKVKDYILKGGICYSGFGYITKN